MSAGRPREGESERGRGWGERPTGAGLSAGVIGVARETVEEVVGELHVGQLWHLEQATRDIDELIMRRIEVCQTVGREREGKRGS